MQIVLIGNYAKDKQESMERFAQMLSKEFVHAGYNSKVWSPPVFLGSVFKSTVSGIGKWLAYFDKWVVFPLLLKVRVWKIRKNLKGFVFHICDHSNAPYLKYLPAEKTSVTCHDVLAIMGALGYQNTFCEASATGRVFQRWILKHLSSAKKLAAVSEQTLLQLQEITSNKELQQNEWKVIYNGFNNNFLPMEREIALRKLQHTDIVSDTRFLLHVGSSLPRKNRKLLVNIASLLANKWEGKICLAGAAVEPELWNYAEELGVKDRLINIVHPDHDTLTALYSTCEAFIFPSFSEGFGWPLIEAQACGAPVIASNIQPMPEVTGGAALYHDPNDANGFADAFISIQDKQKRSNMIVQGFENSKRFNTRKMALSYLALQQLKPLKEYKCY